MRAVGPRTVVVIDLVSFLLAAASLGMLRVSEPAPSRAELHWLVEASAGFQHLFGQTALRRCALAVGAALLVFGTVESGAFAYVDQGLHRPSTFVGLLVPFLGIGVVLLMIAFTTLMQRRTPGADGLVSTASDLLIGVPQTVSIAAGAILVSTVGYRWLFVTSTVGLAIVAATLWTLRSPVEQVREPDPIIEPDPASASAPGP